VALPAPDAPGLRISIGVDLVEVPRVERLIRRYERVEARLFTETEIDYCRRRRRRYEHIAARFAAKEAVLKALGTGLSRGMRWTDVEVLNEDCGRPYVRLGGGVAALAERLGVQQLEISLSHTSGLAFAQALAIRAQES
jgi:holo-[acyl-carrier protein] synthase